MSRFPLVILALLAVTSGNAATHVWNGSASDRFSDAANWTGGSPAGDAEAELLFASTTGSRLPQNDIDGLTVRSISISTGGYTIGGKPITVTRDVMMTVGESTIACDLILAGDVTFFVDDNAVNVRAALRLDGAIRGTGRLIKDGGSPLRMRGRAPNSYSGGTIVRSGLLILEKGANVTCIPGHLTIAGEVLNLLPEQIADDAEVTFEPWGDLTLERNETVASIVGIGDDPNATEASASVNVRSGWATLFVRRDVRASGNTGVFFDRLHLASPLTVTLGDGASLYADFEGDAPVTIRATPESRVKLASVHHSPTLIEYADSDVELPNSPVVQRGGSFTGKAGSLRMEGGTLSTALVGGELSLTAATRVLPGRSISGGPVRLGGATLITTTTLEARPLGTVVRVIQNFSGPVIGTFAGLPEGAVINGYTITYRGGDGNHVELRAPAPEPGMQITHVVSGEKVRLDVVIQFSQDRATGALTVRHQGQLLGTVQMTNGSGTIELTLPPGVYPLVLEYAGDARLAPAKSTYTVRVRPPTPVVTSVEPNVIKSGSGKVAVTVKGSSFIPGAKVVVGGLVYPAEYVSPTELRWTAASRGKGELGSAEELYVSQDPDSVRSNRVPITFEAGPPEDPRRLTITINTITADVRPGATVAMVMTGYPFLQSGQTLLTDSDRDGKVTWQLTRNRPANIICAVVDVETGDSFIEGSEFSDHDELPLPLALHRGRSGAYSNIALSDVEPSLLLWVSPRAGAWFIDIRDGSQGDQDETLNGVMLFDASAMQPVGSSPAAPAAMKRGDVLIALGIYAAEPYATTIDDSHFAPDQPGALALSEDIYPNEEAGAVRLVLFRTDGSAGRVSARVTTFDRTARSGIDYTPFDERVTLEPGEMWKTFEIQLIDDAFFAGARTFGVRLTEPAGAAIGVPETTVAVGEAERAPVLSVDDVSVREGDGPGTAITTIHLTGASRVAIEVDWHLVNSIYPVRGEVVFNPGETRKDIVIPFLGDRIAENDSQVEIGLASSLGSPSPNRGYLRIVDDDMPRISIRDASVTEGSGTRTIEITVDLDLVPRRTVRVNFATRDGSATAGTDYTATTATATFSFLDPTATLRIPIVGDSVAEGPETFEIVLSNPVGAELQRPVGRVTIADDDARPAVSISDASGPEGEYASFVVQLSAPSSEAVTVNAVIAPGTATATDLGSGTNVTITIPAGATTRWVEVSMLPDTLAEPEETFTVTLSSATNATLGRTTATGTILDRAEPLMIVSIGDVQVVEGNAGEKSVTATVFVNRPLSHPDVRVEWSTADGTATAGTDYVAAKGVVTLLSFETARQVTFLVKGDTLREPDETFRIVLANATGAAVVRPEAVVTLLDDEGGGRRRAAGH